MTAAGEVGDCWFLAGLAGAALFEDQLMRLVCTRRDDTLGVFEFTFRPEGRAIKVCVDDGVCGTVTQSAPSLFESRTLLIFPP